MIYARYVHEYARPELVVGDPERDGVAALGVRSEGEGAVGVDDGQVSGLDRALEDAEDRRAGCSEGIGSGYIRVGIVTTAKDVPKDANQVLGEGREMESEGVGGWDTSPIVEAVTPMSVDADITEC